MPGACQGCPGFAVKTWAGKPAPAGRSADDSPVPTQANSDFWEGSCCLDFCKHRQASSCLATLQMGWALVSWGACWARSPAFLPQNCVLPLKAPPFLPWPEFVEMRQSKLWSVIAFLLGASSQRLGRPSPGGAVPGTACQYEDL